MIDATFHAVLFDFDGVIVDSREGVANAINDTLVAHGLEPRLPAALDRYIGPPTTVAFAELTGAPPASSLLAEFIASYHERYGERYLRETLLVDGIREALEAITLPLALATSKPLPFVAPLLERLNIATSFGAVFAPSMSALDEAKPAIVARALEALGTRSAVMVGDRFFDVEAAHANDIPAIGVTWGIGDRAELETAGAEVIVDAPAELVALLAPH